MTKSVRFADSPAMIIGNSSCDDNTWLDRDDKKIKARVDKLVGLIQAGDSKTEHRGLESKYEKNAVTRARFNKDHVQSVVKKHKSVLCSENSLLKFISRISEKQLYKAQQLALQDEDEARRIQREKMFPRQQAFMLQQKQKARATRSLSEQPVVEGQRVR